MNIGTKTVLFGVHQFLIHPWFVAEGWRRLYGFPFDPRLWIAFFLHDLGYFGKPNLDGLEGEQHPEFAAKIMGFLFGERWADFCRYHSRFLAKKNGRHVSRLCVADKMAIALQPGWMYLPMARATGELHEYMSGEMKRNPNFDRTPEQWFLALQKYIKEWAIEHKDCKEDTWTGTSRDLARNNGVKRCTCEPYLPECNICKKLQELNQRGDSE